MNHVGFAPRNGPRTRSMWAFAFNSSILRVEQGHRSTVNAHQTSAAPGQKNNFRRYFAQKNAALGCRSDGATFRLLRPPGNFEVPLLVTLLNFDCSVVKVCLLRRT